MLILFVKLKTIFLFIIFFQTELENQTSRIETLSTRHNNLESEDLVYKIWFIKLLVN